MKKSKLNLDELKNAEVLTRNQLKNVFGGVSSVGRSCICELEMNGQLSQGWWCPDTLDGTVTGAECLTNCNTKYDPLGYTVVSASTSSSVC